MLAYDVLCVCQLAARSPSKEASTVHHFTRSHVISHGEHPLIHAITLPHLQSQQSQTNLIRYLAIARPQGHKIIAQKFQSGDPDCNEVSCLL